MPREEGLIWAGTESLKQETHYASVWKTLAEPGTRQCQRLLHAPPFVLLLSSWLYSHKLWEKEIPALRN